MTLDELNERADELGIPGNAQLVLHEPEVGFWTLEGVDMTRSGEVRLEIQPDVFYETEPAEAPKVVEFG